MSALKGAMNVLKSRRPLVCFYKFHSTFGLHGYTKLNGSFFNYLGDEAQLLLDFWEWWTFFYSLKRQNA